MSLRWCLTALVVNACSLMVPAEPDVVYCRDEGRVGAPACRANHVCADGVCEQCLPSEVCGDGVDNDCNGGADDGCPASSASSGAVAGAAGQGVGG